MVRVGINPRAVCATCIVTSIRYPQLSTFIECFNTYHGLNCYVVSDHNYTCPENEYRRYIKK